ncbi:hypothetical protein MNBD_NITROSPINAE02-361 [hydrothermal vent metagenome]|uniref:STAS domain-containing protein n=1 Tax=hydrothermal vent metagenome TaxID=652676 RepID=A0A3B1CMX8_9ZZZZ
MRIEIKKTGNVTVVELFGNIKTSDDYGLFKDTVDEMLKTGAINIILNCKEVHFINSSGLGRLILASKRVKENGGALKVTNLSDELMELFTFTMLDTKIQIYETEEEALKSFE